MTHNLKVAVFTGSRAEYGLLRHLIKKIYCSTGMSLQLIVSGSHLSVKYGYTVDEIIADKIPISAKVKLNLDSKIPVSMAALAAQALTGVSEALLDLSPT